MNYLKCLGSIITYCLVPFLLIPASAHAALLRYDIYVRPYEQVTPADFDSLGYMLFDVNIGAEGKENVWGNLVDWHFTYKGINLTSENSAAYSNKLFEVDTSTGEVIADSKSSVGWNNCNTRCFPYVISHQDIGFRNPTNGVELSLRLVREGASLAPGTISHYVPFLRPETEDKVDGYYAVSTVPIPSVAWLFVTALFGVGVIKRREGA